MASLRISNSSPLSCLFAAVAMTLIATAAQADEWQLKKSDETRDIRVYQRENSESAFDDVYAVTVLEGRPARIEAILTDATAMPEWLARVAQAKLISRESDAAVIYLRYSLPYPFRSRDAVLMLRRQKSKESVIIEAEAIANKYPLQDGVVRMLGARSQWKVTEAGAHRVKVELWGSGEPGGLIPSMLYNYNLADDAVQTLRQLRRMALRDKYVQAENDKNSSK